MSEEKIDKTKKRKRIHILNRPGKRFEFEVTPGEAFRQLATWRDKSLRQVGLAMGKSESWARNIANANRKIRMETVVKIADVLQFDIVVWDRYLNQPIATFTLDELNEQGEQITNDMGNYVKKPEYLGSMPNCD